MRTAYWIDALERRCLLSFARFGADTAVPETDSGLALDVAVAANGSFIVAAAVGDGPDARIGDLVAVRYDADGEQLGDVITIARNVADPTISISADAVGNAVVAYGAANFVLISNSGVVSAPIEANPGVGGSSPSVSMVANGDFFIGWTRFIPIDVEDDQTVAEVRAFDAQGRPRGNAFTIATVESSAVVYSGLYGMQLAAKPDGSGAIVALTGTSFSEVDVSTTEYFVVDTTDKLASGFFYGYSTAEDVVVQPDGSFVVGYDLYGGSMNDEYRPSWVYAQRVDASGMRVGDAINLGDGLPGPADPERETSALSLAAMPDGGFAATFVQLTDNANPPIDNGNTLYARRYNASGVPDESEPISLGGTAQSPVIGADSNGRTVVARLVPAADSAQFTRITTENTFIQNSVLYVVGTSGDDVIDVSIDGDSVVVARNGQNTRYTLSDVAVIHIDGLDGADTITNNTSLKSTLGGNAGNDTIFGGGSVDRLDGGTGDDSLWGGDANDRLAGGDGKDFLYGNGGHDKIYGGLQGDFIRGNDGRDKLYGNGGNDRIYGGASGDSIYGQGGNDQLFGEGGSDRIYSDYDTGTSTLRGGAGNDVFITANNLVDAIFGDGGRDSATRDDIDLVESIEELTT
jgi:Ca2+-binding RTX toxin-like protein